MAILVDLLTQVSQLNDCPVRVVSIEVHSRTTDRSLLGG